MARDFSPRVNFHCRVSYGVHTPLCAIACINICVHVKDPVVHRRIMETLKHPARTVGWVARLCRSWHSLGKATRLSNGRNPNGTMQFLLLLFLSRRAYQGETHFLKSQAESDSLFMSHVTPLYVARQMGGNKAEGMEGGGLNEPEKRREERQTSWW